MLALRACARLRAGAPALGLRRVSVVPDKASFSAREAKLYKPPELLDTTVETDITLTDKAIHADPSRLLPERQDLVWDDGTAQVEWYVDRDYSVKPAQAANRLLAVLLFGLGGMFATFRALDSTFRSHNPVVPREPAYPEEEAEE